MAAANRRSKSLDHSLEELCPDQRALVQALRDFLLEAGSELQETMKWGAPCYVGRTNVCSIAAHRDHTNLEFYRGTSLRDPKCLLEGTGKNLRHVKFRGPADVRSVLLKPLLRLAIAIDAA